MFFLLLLFAIVAKLASNARQWQGSPACFGRHFRFTALGLRGGGPVDGPGVGAFGVWHGCPSAASYTAAGTPS